MTITTLHKLIENQTRTICGHLTSVEVREYKSDGWRVDVPGVNRNGIVVVGGKR